MAFDWKSGLTALLGGVGTAIGGPLGGTAGTALGGLIGKIGGTTNTLTGPSTDALKTTGINNMTVGNPPAQGTDIDKEKLLEVLIKAIGG